MAIRYTNSQQKAIDHINGHLQIKGSASDGCLQHTFYLFGKIGIA